MLQPVSPRRGWPPGVCCVCCGQSEALPLLDAIAVAGWGVVEDHFQRLRVLCPRCRWQCSRAEQWVHEDLAAVETGSEQGRLRDDAGWFTV
jgi:hypothetical protein